MGDDTRRWDIDERGDGIATGTAAVPRLEALAAHAARPNWVAEEPDVHLWPHLKRAVEQSGSPWHDAEYTIDEDGVLVVSIRHEPITGERAAARPLADGIALIGAIAEGATFIEIPEEQRGADLVIQVVTGVLDDQTTFRSHGHTLRLRITTG